MAELDDEGGVITRTKPEKKTKRPKLFKVLMHNDDYTTRDFVVWVLQVVFRKDESEAIRIMMHVHHTGVGVAGLYTREVAETKIAQTEQLAQEHEYPLHLTMEPEDDED
ncbi:MAG: ATP-dependent Clp protease adaptor ClpS [Myxococcales bacterium]|nr:ATP-dependent Clp protease adaptor ClpS [Myxococcales bacterium]